MSRRTVTLSPIIAALAVSPLATLNACDTPAAGEEASELHSTVAPLQAEPLDGRCLDRFNRIAARPIARQAMDFYNAYWTELSSEAGFSFSVAWPGFRAAEMRALGITYEYDYDEGSAVGFDDALYFYERMIVFLGDPLNAAWQDDYPLSQPEPLSALARKQELREKVDVNLDGRIAFLEYLVFQYAGTSSPTDFCRRVRGEVLEGTSLRKYRLAVEDVVEQANEYEAEKARLTEMAAGTGFAAERARRQLAELDDGPFMRAITRALATADGARTVAEAELRGGDREGSLFWLGRWLDELHVRYGR